MTWTKEAEVGACAASAATTLQKPFHGTASQARDPALARLTRRADYLAARRGWETHTALFAIQARRRTQNGAARIGITASRKVGNAVIRNRVKRRLKEAIASDRGLGFRAGYDYVLIARSRLASAPFETLAHSLRQALEKVHSQRYPPR